MLAGVGRRDGGISIKVKSWWRSSGSPKRAVKAVGVENGEDRGGEGSRQNQAIM